MKITETKIRTFYYCPYCKKIFKKKLGLIVHLKTYWGEIGKLHKKILHYVTNNGNDYHELKKNWEKILEKEYNKNDKNKKGCITNKKLLSEI